MMPSSVIALILRYRLRTACLWPAWLAAWLLVACGESNEPGAQVGRIRVVTTTTGDSPDVDGYTVDLDGTAAEGISINGTLILADVEPGNHQVGLSGVADNCQVGAQQPLAVIVSAGETTDALFTITCSEVTSASGELVFSAFVSDGSVPDVYKMRADGTGRIRLTHNGARTPSWSPDASKIAYVLEPGRIGVMNPDGTGQVTLTNATGDERPSWSPGGDKLVFASTRDDPNGEIYTMNADGIGLQRLTNDSEQDGEPAWSPDGSRIAFISTRGPEEEGIHIWLMDPDGSHLTQLTDGEFQYNHSPVWSPDGARMVYRWTMTPVGGLLQFLAILNVDGTPGAPYDGPYLVDHGSAPAWSPDGTLIAFQLGGDIWLIHPDGSGQVNLTQTPDDAENFPSWAP